MSFKAVTGAIVDSCSVVNKARCNAFVPVSFVDSDMTSEIAGITATAAERSHLGCEGVVGDSTLDTRGEGEFDVQ